jgi:purine-nucleoside phosphorylase
MDELKQQVAEAAAHIRRRTPCRPQVGLLTGTGLGDCAAMLDRADAIAYGDIPHFPVTTVAGHHGRLLAGKMDRVEVLAFQGRFHLYEGYPPQAVAFPIRLLQALGATHLIVTNAAGGINPALAGGDIMLITDHINLTGANPLVGPNDPAWGVRFPDMSRVYDPELQDQAHRAALALDLPLRRGVYAGLRGPSLETPAEIRFLRTIGADAVGLSTVTEVIAAVHAGLRILGLSVITNVADPDHPAPATLEDIIAVADRSAPQLQRLLARVLKDLSPHA